MKIILKQLTNLFLTKKETLRYIQDLLVIMKMVTLLSIDNDPISCGLNSCPGILTVQKGDGVHVGFSLNLILQVAAHPGKMYL